MPTAETTEAEAMTAVAGIRGFREALQVRGRGGVGGQRREANGGPARDFGRRLDRACTVHGD